MQPSHIIGFTQKSGQEVAITVEIIEMTLVRKNASRISLFFECFIPSQMNSGVRPYVKV